MPGAHPAIAREGWPFLAGACAVAAAVTWFAGAWSAPFWLAAIFVLQFFRDPARRPPGGDGLVIAPADGRVIAVGRVRDPYVARDATKVSVFMNVFNVHSNRSPVDGRIDGVWYRPGRFVNAALDKASDDNERNALWIRTDDGQDIVCVQVAGLIARRILCYAGKGDRLARGQRYGFIRFGSRVDLYLPSSARVRVAIGDRVRAGESVVAELVTTRSRGS
jgi:phosphatidylserine decarboxylase